MSWHVFFWVGKYFIVLLISELTSIKEPDNSFPCLTIQKICVKLVPCDVNLQSKQDLICHITKVKFAMSTNSMADVIAILAYLLFPWSQMLRYNQRKNFTHMKKTMSLIITLSMYQQHLGSKHYRLRSKLAEWGSAFGHLLDQITTLLKLNCFLSATVEMQCTFQSSPWSSIH